MYMTGEKAGFVWSLGVECGTWRSLAREGEARRVWRWVGKQSSCLAVWLKTHTHTLDVMS